jgi:SNF2 family DNA or RNA helicase
LILIKNKDINSSFLEYTGELQDKYIIISLLAQYRDSVKRVNTDKWIIPNEIVPLLEERCAVKRFVSPWKDIGKGLKYEPYEYQKETVFFGSEKNSALFLLPTGSGKSFIAITLYNELKQSNKVTTPGIIVVPASLKYQWVKEVSKFSDLVAHSVDTPSKAGKKFDKQFEDCDLLICNYETLKNKAVAEKLKEVNCQFIIGDEIQKINNHKSGIHKAICQFNDLEYRYGMTATPITNNPENVFGIFNFLDPNLFKTHGKFATNYIIYKGYGRVAGVKNVDHLKTQINPYIFMKTEDEISDQLPELIVTPIYCTMPNKTRKINDAIMADLKIAQDAVGRIEKEITNPRLLEKNPEYLQWTAKVMAYQTFAQELADDPRLLSMSESNMANQYNIDGLNSPKLEVLEELISNILDADETVCIFTKYERMQRLLINELQSKFKDIKIAYINGSMTPEERYEQAYTNFQDDPEYKILIMTEAGNAGISLSKCKNLIEYDLADSYANQIQRHGRVKRADSISRVSNVYQIILDESYDNIAQRIIAKKQNYDSDIIKSLKE